MNTPELVMKLVKRIEEKCEESSQLKLDWQRECWQKQFIMIERDFNILCRFLQHDHHVPADVRKIVDRQTSFPFTVEGL